jgi:uncharacterized membrane protein (UPF0127 family)
MNRSIAYLVILVVFASTMGFFIRSTADKAAQENASVFNSMQIREQIEENNGGRVNLVDPPAPANAPTLTIGDTTLLVEIADDIQERSQGLSGRTSLQPNTGMLFLFEEPVLASFWMKDMNFALDFLWIADGVVVDVTENVPPPEDGNLPTYRPNQPVDMVLEVNAGWVEEHGGQEALLGETVFLNVGRL